MLGSTRRLVVSIVAGAVASGLIVSAAMAGPIEERQESMKKQGQALTVIADILKGQREFDAAVVKQQGELLVGYFTHDKTLFPEGSDKGAVETWAKPEIWTDNATFMKFLDNGIAAANELAAVTDKAALGPALGKLGKDVCTACHEKFRRPKE
jgi:cytochrome c556